jgi:hypothetical protein
MQYNYPVGLAVRENNSSVGSVMPGKVAPIGKCIFLTA